MRIFHSLNAMSFEALLGVYRESLYAGLDDPNQYTDISEGRIQAEQNFYGYLKDCFYKDPAAFYAVWECQERYVAALRMEPYRDGLLLEALETAPDARGKGYATSLLSHALAYLSGCGKNIIYAHVDKKNTPSIRVHEKCGFKEISNTASFIDGSFSSSAYTFRRIIE